MAAKTKKSSKPKPRPAKRPKGELRDEELTRTAGGVGFPGCDGGAKDT